MAVLKKRQTGKTLMIGVTLVALLAVAVPAVSAYEAHTVNVQVHFFQPENPLVKTIELITDLDPELYNDTLVPTGTEIHWYLTITVTNTYNATMTDILIRDHLSAELNAVELPESPYDVEIIYKSRGNAKKDKPFAQVRIFWDLDTLEPGQSETLILEVWTRLNPAEHQEYTSTGTYALNSGATMWWYYNSNQKFSTSTLPIDVVAIPPPPPE